jgi:hypothetical protein
LSGRLRADSGARAAAILQNGTTLTGAVSGMALTIDAGSTWKVTGNSILTGLVDPAGVSDLTITNIVGNGHDVHYDPGLAANQYLGGRTYSLVNGGTLTPGAVPVMERSWGAVKAMFPAR